MPKTDMVSREEPQKTAESSSASSSSEGNGASSPNTEPSPPPPEKSTEPTLSVEPSVRSRRAPKQRGAVVERDLGVPQVTTQLPLPAFQPVDVHQVEVSPTTENTTAEPVVTNASLEAVVEVAVEELKDAQPSIASGHGVSELDVLLASKAES
jgi:hypothetical protein